MIKKVVPEGILTYIASRVILTKSAAALLAVAALAAVPSARAASLVFAISPTPVNLGLGGSAAFDVTLTNITGAAISDIGGFSFGITTTDAKISFTSANMSTAATYIFPASDSGDLQLFGTTTISNSTGQTLVGSDFTANSDEITIGAGQTLGLGHVFVSSLLPDTVGTVAITFVAGDTALSQNNSSAIAESFSETNGSITLTPEPGTWLLALPAALSLMWLRRRATN